MRNIERTHIETASHAINWRVEDLFFEGNSLAVARKIAIKEFSWIGVYKDNKAQIINRVYSFDTSSFDKTKMNEKLTLEYQSYCKTLGKKPTKIGGWLFRTFGIL